MSRPTYWAFMPRSLSDLSEQPTMVQLWIGWGVTWSVLGPLMFLRLLLEWWRA